MLLHVHAADGDDVVTNIWVTGVPETWTDADVLAAVEVAADHGDPIAQRALDTLRCWVDQCEPMSTYGTRVYLDVG